MRPEAARQAMAWVYLRDGSRLRVAAARRQVMGLVEEALDLDERWVEFERPDGSTVAVRRDEVVRAAP